MLLVFFCIVLLSLAAKGSKDTECAPVDEKHLQCKFPENIHLTRKDFAVYFLPDTGGEEKVVDCVWINEQLHCIRQAGFECQQPVSDKAVISVPTIFLNKTGSYRCNMNGYKPVNKSSCRFPATTDKKDFADCEAGVVIEKSQVTLDCRFYKGVESFNIKQNKTIIANFRKSDCQSANVCLYQPEDNYDTFRVKLNVQGFQHDKYTCHPDDPSLQLQVKRCSEQTDKPTEDNKNSALPLVALVVSLVCGLILIAVATIVIFFKRRRSQVRRRREAPDRQEREPL